MTADSIADTEGLYEPTTASARLVTAVTELLEQGENLLLQLDAETYRQPVALAFNASMGGHYRHFLDHFSSLLRGLEAGFIDYDNRDRDPRLEQSPQLARELTRALRHRLGQLTADQLAQPVLVRCQIGYGGDSPATLSTLGRELVYAAAHGIHHFALIAVIGRFLNAQLPANFGLAPATLAHQQALAAQSLSFAA
jgi:hypothetical protein